MREKLGVLITLLSINLVSAYNGYGEFSLSNFLNQFDSSAVTLGVIFVVAFAIIHMAIMKTIFKKQPAPAAIVAISLSFLITYFINKSGFSLENFFTNIGLPPDILSILLPILLIGGLIFIAVKHGLGVTVTILGAALLTLSFTELIYEKGITFILGIGLLVLGIFLWSKRNKRKKQQKSSNFANAGAGI